MTRLDFILRSPHTTDAIEATTNAAIGFAVSWAVTFWMLPLWNIQTTASQALEITVMFFLISTVRAYILRRIFRKAENG